VSLKWLEVKAGHPEVKAGHPEVKAGHPEVKAGHPERSLPRSLRQTESKDLHLTMFACEIEFLKHNASC
jgi:hypothetical protein